MAEPSTMPEPSAMPELSEARAWASSRLERLLAEEVPLALLESLIDLLRTPGCAPWLRTCCGELLSRTLSREGGLFALLRCLRGANAGLGDGATAQAVRLLSVTPKGLSAPQYYSMLCPQILHLVRRPLSPQQPPLGMGAPPGMGGAPPAHGAADGPHAAPPSDEYLCGAAAQIAERIDQLPSLRPPSPPRPGRPPSCEDLQAIR